MQCAHTCAHALLRNSRHCPVCSVTKATTEFLKQLLAPVKDYTHKHTHTQIYSTFSHRLQHQLQVPNTFAFRPLLFW